MITLCIDTAYKYLTCALIKDDEIISSYSKECFKRQSEEVFSALDSVFTEANLERSSIDSICISEGPGSYTGTRIAMTIAKVIGEVVPVNVYTISTLRLYAAGKDNCMVVMDARADRVYCGIYDRDNVLMQDCVMPVDGVNHEEYNLMGDGSIFGKEDDFGNIPEAFLKTRDYWQKVEKLAYLTPKYLKESESYYR